MSAIMDDNAFDRALIAAAFELAAAEGWPRVSVADAARRAGLPLDRARARFPGRAAVLLRFGRIADQTALEAASEVGSHRDRLFDMLMRRFDALQTHREGILALLRALPADPPTALLLGSATMRSLAWMLEGAGIETHGLAGCLRVQGLMGVWLATLRAWQSDASPDLSGTMAALDRALSRAERTAAWLRRPFPPRPGTPEGGGTGLDTGPSDSGPPDSGPVAPPIPPIVPESGATGEATGTDTPPPPSP